jgi:exosortase/archaeosortase family protein
MRSFPSFRRDVSSRPQRTTLSPQSDRFSIGSLRPVVGFLLRFAVLWVTGLVLLALLPAVERAAVRWTVASLEAVSRVLPVESTFTPPFLYLGGISLEIVPDCTPLLPALAFAAAVTAFPASLYWKLTGLLLGTALLWLFNVVRLFALIAVLAWAPSLASFAHVFFIQTLTLLLICLLFCLWLRAQEGEGGIS